MKPQESAIDTPAPALDKDAIGLEDFLAAQRAGSIVIVDVREASEFAAGHIPGALNVPLSAFDAQQLPVGKPIVLHCRSGARSLKALHMARAAGRQDIAHYAGGILGWQAAGGPIVR